MHKDQDIALHPASKPIEPRSNPQHFQYLNSKAETLITLGRREEAAQVYELIAQDYPDKLGAFVNLARLAFKQLDFALTLARCEQFLQRFPDEPLLLGFKADSLLALERFEEAEKTSQLLTEKYPEKPVGFIGLVRIAFKKLDFRICLERCDLFMPRFPKEHLFPKFKGEALLALSRFDEAEAVCQAYTREFPDKPDGYLLFAKVMSLAGKNDLALDHCQKLLALFPNDLEALALSANTLIALSRHDEAHTLIQQLRLDYPDDSKVYLSLYVLFRKLEKHLPALESIQKAYQLNPTNVPIITRYATLLELMGKVDEAYQLLEYRVGSLGHDGCLVPLVNLYSKYGKTADVMRLLAAKSDFFAKNPDLQIKVGLALRNIGNLQACHSVFQNHLDSSLNTSLPTLRNNYRIYKQLCLLESITNTPNLFKQYFVGSVNIPKPRFCSQDEYNELFDLLRRGHLDLCDAQLKRITIRYPHDNLTLFVQKVIEFAKELDHLGKHYAEKFLDIGESASAALSLAERVIEKIRLKIPTSMIRLGDGEGNFLTYPPQYQPQQSNDIEEIQRVWWGEAKFGTEDIALMMALFAEAVSNADILGIPDLARKVRSLTNIEGLANLQHTRGIAAIFHHLRQAMAINPSKRNAIFTSCHLHTDLEFWDLYRYILTNVQQTTVITCHPDIGPVITEKFGICSVKIILIPAEHRHSHNFNSHEVNNNHYPDHFKRIIDTLCVETGEVFLVAAGFLGKIYCNEIKNKGGIGIDIGSTADLWMGYSTRLEHEYLHPIQGINIDFDSLRKNSFPGYQKVEKKPYYRSNFYCDMNIYVAGDELLEHAEPERKKLLITGHPRCGSGYMSLLFKQLGFDIGHERFGEDGLCSWLFAVKDLNLPTFANHRLTPISSYFTHFDTTIVYVRNPFDAIPSIIIENRVERSYNFRRNHIINALDIDLDDYRTDLERAVASLVFWDRIVQSQRPAATFKVEDCIEQSYFFLQNNNLVQHKVDITTIDIAANANSTASRGIVKPEVPRHEYQQIAEQLRIELASFCERYGYDC